MVVTCKRVITELAHRISLPKGARENESMIKQPVVTSLLLCMGVTFPTTAFGLTSPFTENFDADAANWLNSNSTALLDFNATGGPDGSSYASGAFNFLNSAEDDSPVILRGTSSIVGASSDGAFFGNWAAGPIASFGVQVRHDADLPLTFFTRFADPNNFPGATAIHFAPVPPNTWTLLEVPINPANPQFVTFEGESFETVFDNIGNVQIGVSVPAALAGVDQEFHFDIDQVSIVPEPAAGTLTSFAALGLWTVIGRRRARPNR